MLTVLIFVEFEISDANRLAIYRLPTYLPKTFVSTLSPSHNNLCISFQILVEANCQINKADRTGCSPLFHAVKSGQRELSRFLVECGACVNQANQSGDRPIHVAALHGKSSNPCKNPRI